MTQQPAMPLNTGNAEEKIRSKGASQAAESSDSSWEDEDDNIGDQPGNGSLRRPDSPASATSVRQTLKHRRRKAHLANRRNDRIQVTLPASSTSKPPRQRYNVPSVDVLLDGAREFIVSATRYAWDVSNRAFHHSRYMLGFLLALWFVALIILRISPTLWGAVSPVCYLPFISSSRLCRTWYDTSKQAPRWADYPKMIDIQSKTFEQLMDDSVGGSALSLEVKRAEMAITDLVSFVRLSKLKAKDTLASSLTEFVQDAKKTGRGLQKLSSKIGGAVDR